jgi:hypothetical protein
MCFARDAHPPKLPPELALPPMAGGAALELLELVSADGTRFSAALAESPQPIGPAARARLPRRRRAGGLNANQPAGTRDADSRPARARRPSCSWPHTSRPSAPMPAPSRTTSFQPPAVHAAAASAEPIAPQTKLPVM